MRPKIATPTPDTESSAATSQEEDEEEAVTQPKRRLISEGDKKKEHVNIVFIGHVGRWNVRHFESLICQAVCNCL